MEVDSKSRYVKEKPVSYRMIRAFILEKHGIKTSNLDIVQVKERHGMVERGEHKQDKGICPLWREELILDAFKHFGIEIPIT